MDLVAVRYEAAATTPMATLDSMVGLLSGVLLFKLLCLNAPTTAAWKHGSARLQMLNTTSANALARIELTAHVTHNQQLIADIDDGVQRIAWTLREVLPETVKQDEGDE